MTVSSASPLFILAMQSSRPALAMQLKRPPPMPESALVHAPTLEAGSGRQRRIWVACNHSLSVMLSPFRLSGTEHRVSIDYISIFLVFMHKAIGAWTETGGSAGGTGATAWHKRKAALLWMRQKSMSIVVASIS